MIGHISGSVILKRVNYALIDVNGVGYKIYAGSDTLSQLKKEQTVSFYTHLVVRENALDLYGFQNQEELDFFQMLIDVSGIGPKSALSVMDLTSLTTLRKAIGSNDTSYLTKVSGIGKKTAEKIVLELRDKLEVYGEKEGDTGLKEESEVLEALQSLGYSMSEARDALKHIGSSAQGTSEKIKAALKILSNA
ncbi:Holliday junction branch migration protein RuvA [Candidatus Wolfebacteria bacterium]|nr:MAG: Holliday junction branch migration protein RuvA [Candidatus Wolfebacteria bacterium]